MTNLKKSIAAKIYRADCPEPVELGEFHLGMLPVERTRQIQAHLKECVLCAREEAGLHAYLKDLGADFEFTLGERLQTWVARLVPDLSSLRSPGLAYATRGEESQVRVYQAGDAQLNLEVQPDPQHLDRRAVLGLLIGPVTDGVQAHLLQEGREIAATPLDDLGNFILSPIPPGTYSLLLRGPSFEIVIEELDISM